MNLLRFFYIYSFIAIVGLIEATLGKWNIWEIGEGIIYAVVIPFVVVSVILILSLVYERFKTRNGFYERKNSDRSITKSMTKLVGLLALGIILAYFPALIGGRIKPILGWFCLFIVLPVLYRLDKIVESD
ncbi:hypothetical protein ADU37_CDS12110 [Thermococcus sp. 2319x1]|uniref:hypothetical protein n=1 Tax=Thermococcus sp. 2319x1 TaxID=1674923 RepID=UPI00073A9D64|nr:hypothetical protein [Thermococcus sp. 2319x1]ALV62910.1 hypothetical protein ADU37_CDS12110 [Thermococcus sp. 2319x1]